MSVSTDGQICFGVLLEEGTELPWEEDRFSGDIEDWWTEAKEWNRPFELYDENGNFLPGMETQENIDTYYDSRREFIKNNPVPIEDVNVCSGDYPVYILAVKGTLTTASRGYPEEINPEQFVVDQKEVDKLLNFIEEFNIECDATPKWYLSSYWG